MRAEKNGRAAHADNRTGIGRRRSEVEAAPNDRISTIHAGQGARVTTRKNAAQAASGARKNAEKRYFERHPEAKASAGGPERSGRNVVLLVVLAVLALCLVFILGRCVTAIFAPGPAEQAIIAEQEAAEQLNANEGPVDAPFEQTGADGTVSYEGSTYSLQMQDDGLWGVVETAADGTSSVIFKIEGTPVALARRQTTILVPENRNDGWDVVCYVIGGHSPVSYVVDEDGGIAGGSGDIASVELDETSLHVTDAAGGTTDIALS